MEMGRWYVGIFAILISMDVPFNSSNIYDAANKGQIRFEWSNFNAQGETQLLVTHRDSEDPIFTGTVDIGDVYDRSDGWDDEKTFMRNLIAGELNREGYSYDIGSQEAPPVDNQGSITNNEQAALLRDRTVSQSRQTAHHHRTVFQSVYDGSSPRTVLSSDSADLVSATIQSQIGLVESSLELARESVGLVDSDLQNNWMVDNVHLHDGIDLPVTTHTLSLAETIERIEESLYSIKNIPEDSTPLALYAKSAGLQTLANTSFHMAKVVDILLNGE